MLTHKQIWAAIDALAARYGMSPSGLARKSGLDATTFNPSKRTAEDGKKRWPSTESVSKVLAATGASLVVIGKSLGHKSTQATEVYSRLNLDPVRDSMQTATRAMLAAGGLIQTAEIVPLKKTA